MLRINADRIPLLGNAEPLQQNCFQCCLNKFACIVLAPERACESIVRKVADLGQHCGLGARAAKIALVISSSAILLEFGSFVARQYLDPNNGIGAFFFVRPMSLLLSGIALNHCLPLNGNVSCGVFCGACSPGESHFGLEVRQNREWIIRSVLLTISISSVVNGLMIHNTPVTSSKEIAEFVCGGIIAFTSVWVAAGLSELIRCSHVPSAPLIPV